MFNFKLPMFPINKKRSYNDVNPRNSKTNSINTTMSVDSGVMEMGARNCNQ